MSEAVPMLVGVGAATVTFLGVVFSLLFLVVQFGSTTFTPRLNLFRDAPIVWRAFAYYVGVVVYSFTAFRGVLLAIILYRSLQGAAFKSVQLASTFTQITERGRQVIDGLHTAPVSTGQGSSARSSEPAPRQGMREVCWPHHSAVIQVINVPRVLRAAESAGVTVEFTVGAGDVIAEGAAIAMVSGPPDSTLGPQLLKAITVGDERTFEQDPALALRLLADIALRALSPAVNDPTTAVDALDRIASLLRVLGTRDLDAGNVADSDGTTRIKLVLPTWDDYLAVALDEIIALPGLLPTVTGRLARLLDDISANVPPDREPAIDTRRNKVARDSLEPIGT